MGKLCCSESGQLFSKHVNLIVSKLLLECPHFAVMWTLNCLAQDIVKYSYSSEIGATSGMMVCLVVIVIAVIITAVLCWWR